MQDIEKLAELPNRGKHVKTWDEIDRHHVNRDRRFYIVVNRWLDSQVGKNVDVVYSDWHRADWVPIKFKTIAQFGYWVELNTFEQNGTVFYYTGSNFTDPTKNFRPVSEGAFTRMGFFYVNPKTKLIEKIEHVRPEWRKRNKRNKNSNLIILGPYHQLNKINGIWYESRKTSTWGDPNQDLAEISTERGSQDFRYPSKPDFSKVVRRQLNKKELKKYNLKND
jgi:hypothetical protein